MNILGIYYSYNQNLQTEENFFGTIKIVEKVLEMPRTRNLTLEGKITVFTWLELPIIIIYIWYYYIWRSLLDRFAFINNAIMQRLKALNPKKSHWFYHTQILSH